MHVTTVYIEPKDVLNNLTEEYKKKFNRCVFTDCQKMNDGTVNITCLLIDDKEEFTVSEYRYKVVLPTEPQETNETENVNKAENAKESEETEA